MTRLMLAGFRTSHRRALCAAAKAAGCIALACDLDEVDDLLRLDGRYTVVLDLTSEDGAGVAVAEAVRAVHPQLPLVGLSGFEPAERRATWLGTLDRCLPISEDPQVVLAEVSALGRRCRFGLAHIVQVGPVVLDVDSGSVNVGAVPVKATVAEFKLLHFLMVSAGEVVTKQAIHAEFYGGRDVSPKIIDVYVCKLRGKLAAAGAPAGFIKTIWGRGHSIDELPFEPVRGIAA